MTQTGSTNQDVAEQARAGAEAGLVLVAEAQTTGRGRRGREWSAAPRSALTFSVLLRPAVPPSRWAWLSLLAGVAVTDALRRDCGLEAGLKWPNDVLVPPAPGGPRDGLRAGHREPLKVAGLLSEVVTTPTGPAVVLGIGINVSQDAAELPGPTAISLRMAGAARTGRDPVLRSVLRTLERWYSRWEAAAGDPRASVAAAFRERCQTIGRDVRVILPSASGADDPAADGPVVDGVAEGVDDEGRLLVRVAGAEAGNPAVRAFAAGDVVHIRPRERA